MNVAWNILAQAEGGSAMINVFFLIALACLPVYMWNKISKWNRERNEILSKIESHLNEIRKK